jgi:hypothetical protein
VHSINDWLARDVMDVCISVSCRALLYTTLGLICSILSQLIIPNILSISLNHRLLAIGLIAWPDALVPITLWAFLALPLWIASEALLFATKIKVGTRFLTVVMLIYYECFWCIKLVLDSTEFGLRQPMAGAIIALAISSITAIIFIWQFVKNKYFEQKRAHADAFE